MTTKLNLTIDENLVAKAKVYAAKKRTSVSRLVENLLTRELKQFEGRSSLTSNFAGILSGKLSDENINRLKKDEISEKYGYKNIP